MLIIHPIRKKLMYRKTVNLLRKIFPSARSRTRIFCIPYERPKTLDCKNYPNNYCMIESIIVINSILLKRRKYLTMCNILQYSVIANK